MRFYTPKHNEEKIKRVFLFIPLTIYQETRWLEFATVKYRYLHLTNTSNKFRLGWKPIEFVNE